MNRVRLTRRELLLLAGASGVTGAMAGRSRAARRPIAPDRKARGSDLQKTMIWTSAPEPQGTHFVAFRKQFTLPTLPQTALLHLFADVRYLLWINGQYVTRGPARFNPKGPEYDSIPVTPYLKAGDNTLAVLVLANASNGKMMHHAPGLTARLEAATDTVVGTDTSWKWSARTRYGPPEVEWGNVRDRVDAGVEDGDWTLPGYDDTTWQAVAAVDGAQWGALTPRRIPLLRETPLPAALSDGQALPMTLTAGQNISFDVGRLAQAYTVLDLDADAGTTLTLTHAGIPYTARPGRQNYVSSDTCGFQTATLHVNTGRLVLHEFRAVERLYPFDCVGSFHSSDPLLDKIWAMCARSVLVMSEDSYVDCADRERTEWMDDDPPGFDITRTAFAGPGVDGGKLYADPRLLEEMLRRTALTQQPDGWVKAHTCSDRFDIHAYMEDRSCDWVEGARRYYDSTQNPEPIREIWPVIVTQMDWFLNRRTTRGLVRAREWVVWGNPMGYQTCEGAGLNAFVYKALVDAAYLGGVIGEKAEAARFAQAARALSAAFNSVLWDENSGTYYSGFYAQGDENTSKLSVENGLAQPTMFPALWALDQDIVPPARRARVTRYLLANRRQASRVMTFYYLFEQLYALQEAEADREVLDTLRTKWQGMAETGWKTSWEEFEGASKAHIYGSFPGYFLSAYVLGVRRTGPVWERRLLIEPRLGDLEGAEGTVVTEYGPVPVAWKRRPGRLDFHLTVPVGVTATVKVPRLGAKARLVLNGKPVLAETQGRYFVVTLRAGGHSGTSTFVDTPPPPPAPVVTRTSGVSEAAFEADIRRDSLIGLGRPTFLSTTDEKVTIDGGGTNADALRNGTTRNGAGGDETTNDGQTFRGYGDGDTVTFHLDTSKNTRGYDLTEIATFAGHADARASQNYSVSISHVSAPAKFVTLVPMVSVTCGGGSSEVIIRDPAGGAIKNGTAVKARGVAAIRFDFRDGPVAAGPGTGFNVYREVQILGEPTEFKARISCLRKDTEPYLPMAEARGLMALIG